MLTKHVQNCRWCYKSFFSTYKNEVICQVCDSELINLDHQIYYQPESQELILNGYSIKDIRFLIASDMDYSTALKTLRLECDKLVDNF